MFIIHFGGFPPIFGNTPKLDPSLKTPHLSHSFGHMNPGPWPGQGFIGEVQPGFVWGRS